MRVWLLFFSGIIAGYLAWTSRLFGREASHDGAEASEVGSEKVRWRDWVRFAFDGLSGRYLYNAVTSRKPGVEGNSDSARKGTRVRTRRDATKES
jgi:hypothetical protein